MGNWLDVWDCMETECKEQVVLLPFPILRDTLDQYLTKHSFCSECTNMVNRAYNLLVEEGQEPAKAAGELPMDGDPKVNRDGSVNLYSGISACTKEGHVHVECDAHYISQLLTLAEPELSGLRQERHAKTIEIAQKEVLICIGLALFERFQRIQQRIREGEQTCDLLLLVCLKTLRRSLDMAAEGKRGEADIERLCLELEDAEVKKKEGKRERKRNRRARKKESKTATLAKINSADSSKVASDGESNSGDSGVSIPETSETLKDDREENEKENINTRNFNHSVRPQNQNQILTSKITFQPRESFSMPGQSLEAMLEDDFEEDEDLISQEEIRKFLAKSEDMAARRQQLRENLKQRFAQLCVDATAVSKSK